MFRSLTLLILASAALALSACNTVKGLGRDIESVGEKGEKIIH